MIDTELLWYSPCGYSMSLFTTAQAIPNCPRCGGNTWQSWKPDVAPSEGRYPVGKRHACEGGPLACGCWRPAGSTDSARSDETRRLAEALYKALDHMTFSADGTTARRQAKALVGQTLAALSEAREEPDLCGCTFVDDIMAGSDTCPRCHHREHGLSGCRAVVAREAPDLPEEVTARTVRTDVSRGIIALALHRAGIRGTGKDGLPWVVAEGVQVAIATNFENAAKVRRALSQKGNDGD